MNDTASLNVSSAPETQAAKLPANITPGSVWVDDAGCLIFLKVATGDAHCAIGLTLSRDSVTGRLSLYSVDNRTFIHDDSQELYRAPEFVKPEPAAVDTEAVQL